MQSASVPLRQRGFRHEAFGYETPAQFLEFTMPFVAAAVEEGEGVFIAASRDCAAALAGQLGPDPGDVTVHDTAEWAPHPATRLRAFHKLVTKRTAAGARHLRLMGEPIWTDPAAEFRREWARYESALNEVLAPFPATLVCLYDAGRLDRTIVDDSTRTHPELRGAMGDGHSAAFEPPAALLAKWTAPAAPPPVSAAVLDELADLAAARRWVERQAHAAGTRPEQAADLGLAVNELLTNARLYAGGATGLAAWVTDGRFVCQVEDAGPGVSDPLAGYRPPRPDQERGRGLWLARQLTDLVEILPGRPGTVVKLHTLLGA